MTIMEQEAMRRKAMAMQAEYVPRALGEDGYIRSGTVGFDRVTNAEQAVQPAAKGRAGQGGRPKNGQKIAKDSAVARATEARTQEKTKPNKHENEFMKNLMILRNSLKVNAPACRERARAAGRFVWRDIRLLDRLVEKVQDALLETMPKSRDEYYSAYAKFGHYELCINGPVPITRHMLITDRHLADLCEAAMKSECILCMREGDEIGRCKLREALLESAPPEKIEPDGLIEHCEYRKAAGQLLLGEEVTI